MKNSQFRFSLVYLTVFLKCIRRIFFVCAGGIQAWSRRGKRKWVFPHFFHSFPLLCPWMLSDVSVLCWNLILFLPVIWTLQSEKIHVIATCTVMTPAHGRDRDSFDWWGFKERLNDGNKSGFRGQAGPTDVCNKTVWSGLIKEQLRQMIPCNCL